MLPSGEPRIRPPIGSNRMTRTSLTIRSYLTQERRVASPLPLLPPEHISLFCTFPGHNITMFGTFEVSG